MCGTVELANGGFSWDAADLPEAASWGEVISSVMQRMQKPDWLAVGAGDRELRSAT